MINFTEIVIEGYRSTVEPVRIDLSTNGLTVIRGRVGSGKSNIPSSLVWALYGVDLKGKRDVLTWQDKRPRDYNGTYVSVAFQIGKDKYRVERSLKRKKSPAIKFTVNGKSATDEKKKASIQSDIESVLGYSRELFVNTIVFGQRAKRLIEATPKERNQILEDALNINFIDLAKKNSKIDKDKEKSKLNELELKESSLLLEESKISRRLEKESTKDKAKKKTEKKIKKLKAKLGKCSGDVKRIKKLKIDIKTLELERDGFVLHFGRSSKILNKWLSEDTQLSLNITALEKIIATDKKSMAVGKCSKCGGALKNTAQVQRDITNKTKEKKALDKKLKDCQKTLKKFQKTVDSQERRINELKGQIDKKKALLDAERKDEAKKLVLKAQIKQYKEDISELGKTSPKKLENLKKEKRKIQKSIKALTSSKSKVDKRYQDLEFVERTLSQPQFKSFILNSKIDQLNDFNYEYAKLLGWYIEMGFTDSHRNNFEIKISDSEGFERDLTDLSGGQGQLANLCISFGSHDLVNTSKPINILFMDEIFENLDKDSVSLVNSIVQRKAEKYCTFIITHSDTFNPTGMKILRVDNQDGRSEYR